MTSEELIEAGYLRTKKTPKGNILLAVKTGMWASTTPPTTNHQYPERKPMKDESKM